MQILWSGNGALPAFASDRPSLKQVLALLNVIEALVGEIFKLFY
jgi:hypothetical protein